jgi:hypothetical protein
MQWKSDLIRVVASLDSVQINSILLSQCSEIWPDKIGGLWLGVVSYWWSLVGSGLILVVFGWEWSYIGGLWLGVVLYWWSLIGSGLIRRGLLISHITWILFYHLKTVAFGGKTDFSVLLNHTSHTIWQQLGCIWGPELKIIITQLIIVLFKLFLCGNLNFGFSI